MAIVHIVQFKFASTVEASTVTYACSKLLALKDQCLHPDTGKPYIMNMSGGRDNSPEGLNDGLTHAFVVIFENEADRKHYLEKDRAHLGFVEEIVKGGLVEKVVVMDYVPNEF